MPVSKPRKPRPSRARGLRTTTGCLTCRKRRVKCDEGKPHCGQCLKSERECTYAYSTEHSRPTGASGQEATTSPAQPKASVVADSPMTRKSIGSAGLFGESPELRFDLSPVALSTSLPSPNSAPFEWYDLLAEDAINNIQKHNQGSAQISLSRRQSPVPDAESDIDPQLQAAEPNRPANAGSNYEPWKSSDVIPLNDDEIGLFHHYINVLGPVLDLLDPLKHFSNLVPKLAVHNVGLLKSLLALSARHMALLSDHQSPQQAFNAHTPVSHSSAQEPVALSSPLLELGTQYYYETLQYLSQNLLYPAYNKSAEIIATAILISMYEMFDSSGRYSNGAWEHHMRGIFWIQRSQDNNGETKDGLRRAAWWMWLRQDIWVAFRESRRVLTIWRPTKRLVDLTPDELATRIVYICARCVDFAANEKQFDMNIRIDQGDKLLQALEDWYRILPPSFQPIYTHSVPQSGLFAPIWIHPPSYAAAIQMFHFARIVVLINQPSLGGMSEFSRRQRFLDESVESICGIALVHQGNDLPSAFVNYQALYAAGLCVQTPVKQNAVMQLLEKTLDVTKFPPKTLLDDLTSHWRAES
ncbi:hypothetical protein BU23DRAFT_544208 [Bimuria novae-zelandiae CBS 107.79]|uniref:Zn(2)-C6 fungal-type domain-containing protein n=1 Tax=Bimuria novae-zelandiae CBS 107.79 TaxID=1447943 RepID=A0A6A5UUD9_9PLEO|nr:hypothetical protein BU23DRAFT_544208 [Bimuria novae-zelandiae CBS 107.79]